MWNNHWQDEADYGTRYDYGFYEISTTEMKRFRRYNRNTPTKGWVATKLHSNKAHKLYQGELEPNTEIVDGSVWERVRATTAATPNIKL